MTLKVNSFFLRKIFVLASFFLTTMMFAAETLYNIMFSNAKNRRGEAVFGILIHEKRSRHLVGVRYFGDPIQSHYWTETKEFFTFHITLYNGNQDTIEIPKN